MRYFPLKLWRRMLNAFFFFFYRIGRLYWPTLHIHLRPVNICGSVESRTRPSTSESKGRGAKLRVQPFMRFYGVFLCAFLHAGWRSRAKCALSPVVTFSSRAVALDTGTSAAHGRQSSLRRKEHCKRYVPTVSRQHGRCINRFPATVCVFSGKVAKEVMEQSAKIKRDPPEIHRSGFSSDIPL